MPAPDFQMKVRKDWYYLDFYTYPREGTRVLVGRCRERPFWWLTPPKKVAPTPNPCRQGSLEVECVRQNWYTPDLLLSSDRCLAWRIGVPAGFPAFIVLYTPGREVLGARSAPFWEENSYQILYAPRSSGE